MLLRLILPVCFLISVACSSGQQYYIERADHFVVSGDDASAAVEFEKALQAGKPDWKLQSNTADCYARLKDYEKALKHYDAAVTIMENDIQKFSKMAAEEKDPDQKRLYTEIVETYIYPLLAGVYVAQARIYSATDKLEAFSAAAKLALICDERNLVARRLFAQSLEKRGDYKGALKEWTAFLALARNTAPSEREANGITQKELKEAEDRIADLFARQTQN
jgi:tetratricopeptide (TPR) repeat protein